MSKYQLFAFADEASPMIDGQIAAMKRNALTGLEIRNVDGTNVSDITADKAREVRRKLDDAGLITWSIGSPIGKIAIDTGDFAAECDKLRRTLETADILGAKNIRMFSFYLPQEADPQLFRGQVMDQLGKLAEIADGTGVTLCHENEKGIYGDNAARCLDIYQTLPAICGVFDPANFVQCGQDTLEAWQLLAPYIRYMHIKDSLPDGNVVPAGKGVGHVQAIAEAYLARGGQAFTMEPHLKVFSGLSGLERAGEETKVGLYVFDTNDEAFDAASNAFKALL